MKGIEMKRYHCMKCGKDLQSNNKSKVCIYCQSTFSEFQAWKSMKDRCSRKNHRAYENYGGRGITVCDEWVNSFPNFYRDMGDKPSLDLSLDREDNEGNYYKDNCKWSTSKEQNNNQRERTKIKKNHPTGVKGIGINKYGKFVYSHKRKYLGLSTTLKEAEQKLKAHIENLIPA